MPMFNDDTTESDGRIDTLTMAELRKLLEGVKKQEWATDQPDSENLTEATNQGA